MSSFLTHPKLSRLTLFMMLALLVNAGGVRAQGGGPEPHSPQAIVGSAFTYQGRLTNAAGPVTAICNLGFQLYDAAGAGSPPTGGNQIGNPFTTTASVVGGLFTVALDFGAAPVFNGEARYLQIAVQCPGDGAATTLSPRQALTPVPYALALPGLRTEPNITSTNLIGGYVGNAISPTVVGATIGGGGGAPSFFVISIQHVTDNYGTVGGGYGNVAGNSSGTVEDAEYATVSGGFGNAASASGAFVGGGGNNRAGGSDATVGGGSSNQALAAHSTIGGGQLNVITTTGSNGTIAGGFGNDVTADRATVGGGSSNVASGLLATIGGGHINSASGEISTIGGGLSNNASGNSSTIGGGWDNTASGMTATVGGGWDNLASGNYSTVGGGYSNTASSAYASIGGGWNNGANGYQSTVGGGWYNQAAGQAAAIGGGTFNTVNGVNSTVAGGSSNTVNGDSAAIGGGSVNFVYANTASIGGGINNRIAITGVHGTIGGGSSNVITGYVGTIAGGIGNRVTLNGGVVGGGVSNTASGIGATVPGGQNNTAQGDYSLAAGLGAQTLHDGAFVWADSTGTFFPSTASNQFLIRAAGGVGIGTNSPTNALHVVEGIDNTGTPANHVALIENNFPNPTSGPDVLALRITNLVTPGGSSNYITFFGANSASLGSIEGNGAGGVVMSGPGNDFAEYLPQVNPGEALAPGSIVGLFNGQVSLRTAGAERVFVISSAPIIAGNKPGNENTDGLALVALLGQAPLTVVGPVNAGDFILPSGQNDGKGMAVAPEVLTPAQAALIVGEALESANGEGEHVVTLLIGQPRDAVWANLMTKKDVQLDEQRAQLQTVEARLTALEQANVNPWLQVSNLFFLAAGVLLCLGAKSLTVRGNRK